jgi:hypothetical protein
MEPTREPPWIRYGPDVSGEHLAQVAAIIVEARRAVAEHRTRRDWPWNFHCSGYVWILDDLIVASGEEHASWLRMTERGVLDAELRFGDSVKFVIYRADAGGQPGRTLKHDREVAEEQGRLDLEVPVLLAADPRIAYWLDENDIVTAVAVQHLDLDGDVAYDWPVYVRDAAVMGMEPPTQNHDPEGIPLDAPDPQLGEDVDTEKDRKVDIEGD